MSARWFVSPENMIRIADWQGESHSAVYQPSSGDLHLMSRSGAQLLSFLQEHPCSEDQLQQLYRNRFALGGQPSSSKIDEALSPLSDRSINQYLSQFNALGLIESIEL